VESGLNFARWVSSSVLVRIARPAWVTAKPARGRDEDEALAVGALRAAGVVVEVVDWDDPAVTWASYDRVVIRSAWDYMQRLPAFLDWLEVVDRATDLRNPWPLSGGLWTGTISPI
jgi:hypothetical protein